MDYIWKKNWDGRHYMDVRVSPFYKEHMEQKISEAELTRSENLRLVSLRDVMLGYERLELLPPEEIATEYYALGKKRSVYDVLRRQLLEMNLHGREQEKKFKKRR